MDIIEELKQIFGVYELTPEQIQRLLDVLEEFEEMVTQ